MRLWPTSGAGGCTRWARSTCCPPRPPRKLKEAEEATCDVDGMLVNVAVGYGGRREIADAVRSLLAEHAAKGTSLEELAQIIDVEHIAEHLYTKGQPDPDLVIRTSGEQRLGGFLLWQSAKSSSTSARPTGPTSGRSTSSARSGRTPSASAASAPDARSSLFTPRSGVSRNAPRPAVPSEVIGEWGSPSVREDPFVRHDADDHRVADGGRHSGFTRPVPGPPA